MENLVLASSSPRRRDLLAQLGWSFEICSPDIDESLCSNESAAEYVARLAQEKARAILQLNAQAVVVAADTTVSIDDQILAKPENRAHAFEIWSRLSGRTHTVLTGVCVATTEHCLHQVVATQVEFQNLSLADMQSYWETGEPVDKAGGYAIQGIAAQFIPRIIGSYSNVVGLPLYETRQMLLKVKAMGCDLL